jgi:hypothetical protein
MTSPFVLNAAHLHLVLNHIPTLGTAVAVALLVLALVRRHEVLLHVGLEVLFVIAVVTVPVYVTGVATYQKLRSGPEFSDSTARSHQDVALTGFAVTEFAGFVAWLALWQSRRSGRAGRGLVAAATLLSVVALAIMGQAATLGGEIRHPEIRADAPAPSRVDGAAGAAPALSADQAPAPSTDEGSTNDQFLAAKISRVMVYSTWVWPAAETIHFLGLSLSFGVLLAVNLRILGVMRQVAFADVHRLLPWAMLGFGANLITGMMFFVGQPGQYVDSAPFIWKVVFLMIAGANFLYLTVFKKGWAGDRLDSSVADKAMAVSSLVAWLGVLYAGRMLPFLGNAF